MIRSIAYRDLRKYLLDLGWTELLERNHFRFDHRPSRSVVVLRHYLPGETVSELDLAEVRKTLVERGVVDESSFENFLQKARVIGQDDLDHLYRVFFAVSELGEALRGTRVTSTRFPWLPYDPDFHRMGALDDLMKYLELNGEPLEEWSKKLDSKRGSPQKRSSLKKIAKAIYPLLYRQGCDQARVKEEAIGLLGEAWLDLKKEIEEKEQAKGTSSMGDWASDFAKIWSS